MASRSKIAKRGAPEQEDAAELKLGDEFNDVGCLLNAEVQYLLARTSNGGPTVNDSAVYRKTWEHVQSYSSGTVEQTLTDVQNIRSILDRTEGLFKPFEIAQIGNLAPGSAEEAKALIPSLNRVDDEILQSILDELKVLRSYKGRA
ncbi:HRDC-like protein [Mrakia frigida]|uniref:DNA-directed RNA polymerase II subunit RPB4 n=1 Tax=Mrakia frigida TaxID=29902 RepID=UPI003FCC0B61